MSLRITCIYEQQTQKHAAKCTWELQEGLPASAEAQQAAQWQRFLAHPTPAPAQAAVLRHPGVWMAAEAGTPPKQHSDAAAAEICTLASSSLQCHNSIFSILPALEYLQGQQCMDLKRFHQTASRITLCLS